MEGKEREGRRREEEGGEGDWERQRDRRRRREEREMVKRRVVIVRTYIHVCYFQPSPLSLRFGGLSGLTSTSEVRLLHHAQEQLRRKEESITARRKMFELEDTIRELQERLALNLLYLIVFASLGAVIAYAVTI